MTDNRIADFFAGTRLYGDDLTSEELIAWFESEEEGYANLGAGDKLHYRYEYHELNRHHAFRFLGGRDFRDVLGIGSAYGHELFPIIGSLRKVTILDPSDAFASSSEIMGVPCRYVKPHFSGDMPFDSKRFDLITCFGVMHHIPNVSHVMSEIYRCLADGGLFLIREPIVSQGDWRHPRKGVTANERGIPINLFDEIIARCGFSVRNRAFCDFRPIPLIALKLGFDAYNSSVAVKLDSWVSNALPWKLKYHRTSFLEKFAPASVAYVLAK